MTRKTIDLWLRAMNPLMLPRGMAEAQRSARVTTFALLASSIASLISSAMMALHPEWMATIMANQYALMDVGMEGQGMAEQQAFMSSIMPPLMLVGVMVSVVLYFVLAWVQWKHMTRAIPVILLVLFAYAAITGAAALGMGQYYGLGADFALVIGGTWAVQVVCAVLYVASVRGAFILHRLRNEP
jgi:hypothetical protein